MMKSRYLYNPFYLYILVYGISLFMYSLHWSNLYPPIEENLLFFFFITFTFSLVLGVIFDQYLANIKFQSNNLKFNRIDFVFWFLILSIIIEFLYSGYIPFISYFQGNLHYGDEIFGIKTFHLLVFTFSAFYCIYLFHQFLIFKTLSLGIKFFILYFYPILLMSRSSFLMITVSMLFIYLVSIKKLSIKLIIKLITVVVFILFLFGYLGNVRESANNIFMIIAEPSETFVELNIPDEFMWAYIYISSPVATLQFNINKNSNSELDKFLFSSIFPDVIQKKFDEYENVNKIEQLTSWLTVGTQYSKAYKYFGLTGMYIIFTLMSIFIFLYPRFLGINNIYFISGYSILLVMVVFGIFNNMWVYSALSLQLIYPFLLSKFDKIKFKFSKGKIYA